MLNRVAQSLLVASLLLPIGSMALTFPLPPGNNAVVGQVKEIRLKPGDSLSQIARDNDIGYYELLEANPKLNPMRLVNGTPVLIPTQYVLPDSPRDGITINLAELRLYYYPVGQNVVVTKPISIGRQGWNTPEGTFKVVEKIDHPSWYVPKSIAAEAAKQGVILPDVVPPGPDNPLGDYAMRLSLPNYLIHGTVEPTSIGRRVSSGCVRMYPEDIQELFSMVPVGTPVHIVNQPYKIGLVNNQVAMESHQPLSEMRAQIVGNPQTAWIDAVNQFASEQSTPLTINWQNVTQTAQAETGIPAVIGQVDPNAAPNTTLAQSTTPNATSTTAAAAVSSNGNQTAPTSVASTTTPGAPVVASQPIAPVAT